MFGNFGNQNSIQKIKQVLSFSTINNEINTATNKNHKEKKTPETKFKHVHVLPPP